jgi:hypothetical protein
VISNGLPLIDTSKVTGTLQLLFFVSFFILEKVKTICPPSIVFNWPREYGWHSKMARSLRWIFAADHSAT